MSQPLRRRTTPVRAAESRSGVRREERKPNIPGPYIYVGDFDTLDPPVVTWQSPVWENNFTWVGTRYVGFRHGLDGDTEFIGVLDLTQGAVTGTAAFTLPIPYRGLAFDFPFPIFIGGNDWISGIFSVNPNDDGKCYVYWPTQAIQI